MYNNYPGASLQSFVKAVFPSCVMFLIVSEKDVLTFYTVIKTTKIAISMTCPSLKLPMHVSGYTQQLIISHSWLAYSTQQLYIEDDIFVINIYQTCQCLPQEFTFWQNVYVSQCVISSEHIQRNGRSIDRLGKQPEDVSGFPEMLNLPRTLSSMWYL